MRRRMKVCKSLEFILLGSLLYSHNSYASEAELYAEPRRELLSFKPASMTPGKTPGVAPPGDPFYMTKTCKTLPEKGSNDFDNSLHSSASDSRDQRRKLLSAKAKRKKRIDAWKQPHMNQKDFEKINSLLSEVGSFCPFLIKSCVRPGIPYHKILTKKGYKSVKVVQLDGLAWQNLPQIEQGEWGTCALVGLADTMLRKKHGKIIDSHDYVIRLAELPILKYKEYVGSKTDVTWIRRSAKMAPRGTRSKERPNVRLYIGHNNGIRDMPVLRTFGFTLNTNRSEHSLSQRFYDILGDKNRHPSTGFEYALSLIFSQFCTRTDLYGFSNNGGGAYHNTKHLMQNSHNSEFESWILHYIMKYHEKLGVCVYL